METTKSLKRLFVGGLHHMVSESEIKERFSTFGAVTDVDIVFRKDSEGNPVKTFGYVNIRTSETELKRCMSILNKSKWKGGTLQIELAKECFLHKLAQERQDAAKNKHKPQVDNVAKVVESLKKAGVENFKIRSAVPGTEVPEHKDWIVSKFGRVLPILHLRQKDQKKIVKYDPSKYCHNIKKLDQMSNFEIKTSVTNLTWHLEETDDEEMSKKRRGDFPTPTQPVKRKKLSVNKYNMKDSSDSDSNFQANKMSSNTVEHCGKRGSNKNELIGATGSRVIFSKSARCAGSMNQNSGRQETIASNKSNTWSKAQVTYCDSDSEELELIIEREKIKIEELSQTDEKLQDMPLEVVGKDYVLKHQTHWALNDSKKDMLKDISINHTSNDNGSESDSADTDEIISTKMIPPKGFPKTKSSKKSDSENSKTEGYPMKEESESNSNIGNEDSEEKSSESNLDSDYEEMISSCYRIDLSLTDLEQLANSSSKAKKENSDSEEESELDFPKRNSLQPPEINPLPSASGAKISQSMPVLKENTIHNSMVSAIQDEDSSDCETTPNKQLINPPPFKGTQCIFKVMEENSEGDKVMSDQFLWKVKRNLDKESCSDSATPPVNKKQKIHRTNNVLSSDSDNDMKSNCRPPPFKGTKSLQFTTTTMDIPSHRLHLGISETNEEKLQSGMHKLCKSTLPNGDKCGDYKDSNEEIKAVKQNMVHIKPTNSPKIEPSALIVAERSHVKEKREYKVQIDGGHAKCLLIKNKPNISLSIENNACGLAAGVPRNLDKHLLDNQKRLAALHEKQKGTEMQKKLIQGALSNLDRQKPDKGKHIVFDFEEESENRALLEDIRGSSKTEVANLSAEEGEESKEKWHAAKVFESRTIGKLFDSEEEEDDEGDRDEEHNGRFKIKPQFEGKAGQKLLALQSRFGTDERFRMDERFLESEEENTEGSVTVKSQYSEDEEFAEEKKRALDILTSVIQVSDEKTEIRKEQAKFKKFRDVSALHYDPTREDHIVFENKVEESKKESKSERRKRREEAEMLPEVSKEIYYDVNMGLKEMFSSRTKEEEEAWDMEDDRKDQAEPVESTETQTTQLTFDCLSSSNLKKDSADFTFSFFEAATPSSQKPEFYKIESKNMTTFPWQEDPRFQDHSSEDEDERKDLEDCGDSTEKNVVTFPETKVDLFFFFKDDQRLKDGPKLFCRTTDLEDERNNWEEKRTLLIEEFRKKHKEAKRKIKAKQ
ncbi:nucleolar protein 8 isoform X1 [Carcharodon carcharias]|uniref:nucleolar protein 8 isoform X1 n=1 Tax=Carcharodon carcharias TaxID=13397 RepID=UPI001B7E7646|nr:nucleolar protein 8 isoform X1 [Carcharodon carcharias]XP_041048009.1 nucleolar protein 8 isoform X1 [Carcharodon carcharias]XP_041048010.1 nucleolar protein 8 isoform X1 [Carcharodon carcharias]XP_041048011.1 nucleolar protein 8 isoform X1 [Carcharodon carcharias]